MIQFTPFAPFFIVMAIVAFRSIPAWAMTTLAAGFLQSASPVVIYGGGRVSGMAPAYALLSVGLFHLVTEIVRNRKSSHGSAGSNAALTWLAALTLIGVSGAVFLPRLFEGAVRVLPPAYGLEAGYTEPVRASGRNYIQAFYLVCNFCLFFLCSHFIRLGKLTWQQCFRGLAIGVVVSALLGLYQVIGFYLNLPWPKDVINSNLGVGQADVQTAFGIKRMSATFLEPSLMSMHFLGAFALFGLGLQRWKLGCLLLLCLLLSTSSTAYVGLPLVLSIWAIVEMPRAANHILPIALLFFSIMAGAYMIDQFWYDGILTKSLLTDKFLGTSGMARSQADYLGLQAVMDSFGLGVGVGSTRASSFIVTLAATVGIPGLLCFAGFMLTLLANCFRSGEAPQRALAFGMIGISVAWITSIPDLSLALPWLLAGIAHGASTTKPEKVRSDSYRELQAAIS